MKNNNRLNLLSQTEKDALYGLPRFNTSERAHFLSFSQKELAQLEALDNLATKFYFALQLGYFKAKSIFFDFEFSQVTDDLLFFYLTE